MHRGCRAAAGRARTTLSLVRVERSCHRRRRHDRSLSSQRYRPSGHPERSKPGEHELRGKPEKSTYG
jgi:hypothetical protein